MDIVVEEDYVIMLNDERGEVLRRKGWSTYELCFHLTDVLVTVNKDSH